MPGGIKKEIPGLFPAYDNQSALLNKLPENTIISIKTKVPRNLKKHQQIWAIMNMVYDTLPENYSFPNLHTFVDDFLKMEIGFTTSYKVNGVVKIVPRSESFSQCEENDFLQNFYYPALDLMTDILKIDGTPEYPARGVLIDMSMEYSGLDYRVTHLRVGKNNG